MPLTDCQKKAFEELKSGENVFLTSAAGCGKTFLIEEYYKYAVGLYGAKKVHKTALTGIAAINIGGRTIHSFLGLGIGLKTAKQMYQDMSFYNISRIKNIKVLIIDEVSMLSSDLFDKIIDLLGLIRAKVADKLQLILCGDLLQLPAVASNKEGYCFESPKWSKVIKRTAILQQIVRQVDPVFQKILNEARYGECSKESADILAKYMYNDETRVGDILSTKIYPTNDKVYRVNNWSFRQLEELGNIKKTYLATYTVLLNTTSTPNQYYIDDLRKMSVIPDEIELIVGAQVMFKKNMYDSIDINGNKVIIVNGSRGVITEFRNEYPLVKLLNGQIFHCVLETFNLTDEKTYNIRRMQIPLKLAWAITIHASQGCSIDKVELDIGLDVFEVGMAYVALSRVRDLSGLTLINFDPSAFKADPKVIEFYEKI
jgi:ATP-dependent DNA helicase PIF1